MNSVLPRLPEGIHIVNQVVQLINNDSSVLVPLVFLDTLCIVFSPCVQPIIQNTYNEVADDVLLLVLYTPSRAEHICL